MGRSPGPTGGEVARCSITPGHLGLRRCQGNRGEWRRSIRPTDAAGTIGQAAGPPARTLKFEKPGWRPRSASAVGSARALTPVRVGAAPIARIGCPPGRSPSRTGHSRSPRLGRLPAPGSSELGQHGVEVPDAIIDHERCRARTEVGGVRRERRPNRLLSSRGRRESPVGLLWFDRHAQVFAIPGGECLGIARFEEYTADSKYLFHTNPFSSRLRTCDSLTKTH